MNDQVEKARYERLLALIQNATVETGKYEPPAPPGIERVQPVSLDPGKGPRCLASR